MRHLFRVGDIDRRGSNWLLGAKMCFFDPKILDIWGQKSIFCLVIAIFVDGANDHYTQGSNFPIGTTPKKISVSGLGVIFWGSPLFLAVFGHWRVRRATTLSFGPISTKLGGIVRPIKKMTQKDNGHGPGWNYGETGVFTFGRKVVFGLKMGLTPKNHPKWHFPPWLFGQRALFSLNNFFRSWPEHG